MNRRACLLAEFDLAASIQVVLEDALLRLARTLRKQSGMHNLCMAGGVALNCVANGKLLASGIFDQIWVQPASNDAGGSLGAALAGHHVREQAPPLPQQGDRMYANLLGSSYSNAEIVLALRNLGAAFTLLTDAELCPWVAHLQNPRPHACRYLRYIEVFYNRTRRHSHLGGVSPEAFERAAA